MVEPLGYDPSSHALQACAMTTLAQVQKWVAVVTPGDTAAKVPNKIGAVGYKPSEVAILASRGEHVATDVAAVRRLLSSLDAVAPWVGKVKQACLYGHDLRDLGRRGLTRQWVRQ